MGLWMIEGGLRSSMSEWKVADDGLSDTKREIMSAVLY
jgi:hypothetical protein